MWSLATTYASDFVVVNPTSFNGTYFTVLAETLPEGKTLAHSGKTVITQATNGGTLVEIGELGPYSLTSLSLTDLDRKAIKELSISRDGSGVKLENSLLSIEFNPSGDITRIFDKAVKRKVLSQDARANVFQVFEDRPMMFDAWDIDMFYDDKMWKAEKSHHLEIIQDGPVRVGL